MSLESVVFSRFGPINGGGAGSGAPLSLPFRANAQAAPSKRRELVNRDYKNSARTFNGTQRPPPGVDLRSGQAIDSLGSAHWWT